MRIGFYSPFWGSTLGGGEKYLGTAAAAVRDAWPEHRVEIVSPAPADRDRYESFLGLDLEGIGLRSLSPAGGGGGLLRRLARRPELHRARNLVVSARAVPVSAQYDLWISMVYVLPAFSRARRGVVLCQFPYPLPASRGGVGGLAARVLRRRLFGGEVAAFDGVVCQSEFVREWVRRLWHVDSEVVWPPIDLEPSDPDWDRKDPIVLSVGRFFAGGHSKRHDVMARAFRQVVDRGGRGWQLHLVGSLHENPDDQRYMREVRRLAQGYPIHIHTDLDRARLRDMYRRASIYWHAAGFGVDPAARPVELEHFGMTTVEAMGSGAVPVVIAAGGQTEIVRDGVDGYLWSSPEHLVARTEELMRDGGLRHRLGAAARQRSLNYSAPVFRERMVAALRPHVEALARR